MSNPTTCEKCGKLAFEGTAVTVPGEEYHELLRKAEAFDRAGNRMQSFRSRSHSKIALDPELATFLIQASQTMLQKDARLAAIERFGADRVPSRSSVHRFFSTVSGMDRFTTDLAQ